jgi:UDP-N-acetylmuramoylalanine--D-glutamate ligase
MNNYNGQRVTVVGLGREGLAVTRVLAREGARVTVSDARDARALAQNIATLDGLGGYPVRYTLGSSSPDTALDCDLLVLSPGVDKRAPLVREALRRGIPITSETELFMARCPAPIIGITGSSGKTTTTTLIGEMLRRGATSSVDATSSVYVGGNIGRPLLERLDEITPDARVVLELSSFQLEWLTMSPAVAVVTNLTPNHLDRHETMDAYAAAKSNIVAHQGPTGTAVLNADDPLVAAFAGLTRGRVLYFSLVSSVENGAYLASDGETLLLARDGRTSVLCRASELRVPGRHTIANVLAAASVATLYGVAPQVIAATARAFDGVPHRLQRVGTIAGVTFYDDSIATTPERTRAALAAIPNPVVLILGGHDKMLPWEELARDAIRRCRGVVLIGEAAGLIRRHIEAALHEAGGEHSEAAGAPLLRSAAVVDAVSMTAAVERALEGARPGDAIVLAPGCASYDMYRDFEERGDLFARAVGEVGGW